MFLRAILDPHLENSIDVSFIDLHRETREGSSYFHPISHSRLESFHQCPEFSVSFMMQEILRHRCSRRYFIRPITTRSAPRSCHCEQCCLAGGHKPYVLGANCAIVGKAHEMVSRRTKKESPAEGPMARVAYDLIQMAPAYNMFEQKEKRL